MIVRKWLWRNLEVQEVTKVLDTNKDNKIDENELLKALNNPSDPEGSFKAREAVMNAKAETLKAIDNFENTVKGAMKQLAATIKVTPDQIKAMKRGKDTGNMEVGMRNLLGLGVALSKVDNDNSTTEYFDSVKHNIADNVLKKEIEEKKEEKKEEPKKEEPKKEEPKKEEPKKEELKKEEPKKEETKKEEPKKEEPKKEELKKEEPKKEELKKEEPKKEETKKEETKKEETKKEETKKEETGTKPKEVEQPPLQPLSKELSEFNTEKTNVDQARRTYESAKSSYEAAKNRYDLATKQTAGVNMIRKEDLTSLEKAMKKAENAMEQAGREKEQANAQAKKKLGTLIENSGELGQKSQEAVKKTKEKTEKTIKKTEKDLTQMNEKYKTSQDQLSTDITESATELKNAATAVSNSSTIENQGSARQISREKNMIIRDYMEAESDISHHIAEANAKIEQQSKEISASIQSVIDSYTNSKNAMQSEYNKLAANKKVIDGVIGGLEKNIATQKEQQTNLEKQQKADKEKLTMINTLRTGGRLDTPISGTITLQQIFDQMYPTYNGMNLEQKESFLRTESEKLLSNINKTKATLEGTKNDKGEVKTKPLKDIIADEEKAVKDMRENTNYTGLEKSMVSILGDIQGYEKNISIKDNELKKNNLEKDINQLNNSIKEQDAYIGAREVILTSMTSKITAKEAQITVETDQTRKSALINEKKQLLSEKTQFEQGLNTLKTNKAGLENSLNIKNAQLDAVNTILKAYTQLTEQQSTKSSGEKAKDIKITDPTEQFKNPPTSRLQQSIPKSSFPQ